MDVRLLVHLERVSEGSTAWWGESPDVPGFSVTSDSLSDLLARAQWALVDVLAERDKALDNLVISLVTDAPLSRNPATARREADGPTSTGDDVEVASVTRPLHAVA